MRTAAPGRFHRFYNEVVFWPETSSHSIHSSDCALIAHCALIGDRPQLFISTLLVAHLFPLLSPPVAPQHHASLAYLAPLQSAPETSCRPEHSCHWLRCEYLRSASRLHGHGITFGRLHAAQSRFAPAACTAHAGHALILWPRKQQDSRK